MTTLYKLTTRDGKTRKGCYNETQWGEGIKHRAKGPKDGELCSNSFIHAYEHPIIAVLMNPAHADIRQPLLWEARGKIAERNGSLKVGCRSLTTIKQIEMPKISLKQKRKIAKLCGLEDAEEFRSSRLASELSLLSFSGNPRRDLLEVIRSDEWRK